MRTMRKRHPFFGHYSLFDWATSGVSVWNGGLTESVDLLTESTASMDLLTESTAIIDWPIGPWLGLLRGAQRSQPCQLRTA